MCLKIDPKETERVKSLGDITAYKVVIVLFGYIQSTIYEHLWKVGVNEPTTNFDFSNYRTEVRDGSFHVFLNEIDALRVRSSSPDYRIMKVLCKAEDLIAAGPGYDDKTSTAAYSKVYLSEEEYNRVLRFEE